MTVALMFQGGNVQSSNFPASHDSNASSGNASRPNIVLILGDDLGYECLGTNGSKMYKTPNIDRLATQGVRFTQCHVQPLCTPTRVELMTGLYNVRNYVNFGTLPRTERTFGQVFKEAGYATAICGKWQLGTEQDSPQHFGFEEDILWHHIRRAARYANPGLDINGVSKDFTNGEYGPDLVNSYALDFITRKKDVPFFLYYPMMLVHNPFQPTPDSPDWDPKTEGENDKQKPAHFAEMITYMDKLVGTIVARLEKLGIRDNTLVIFLGDNGTNREVMSVLDGKEYPGGKGLTAANGTNVPLIASWPARVTPGRISRDLVGTTDFFPTICQAAGIKIPAGLDGTSFLPVLLDEKGPRREWLYGWYSPRQNLNNLTIAEFVRDGSFKLYRTGKFYNVVADPFEKTPIDVATQPEQANKLRALLDRFKNARSPAMEAAAVERARAAKGKGAGEEDK